MFLKGKEETLRTIADLKPGLDPKEAIADLDAMYMTALDNSNDEHVARQGVLHPSSVGYCKRANVYQRLGTPPSDRRSKEFIEIVTMGHLVHDILQHRLEQLTHTLAKFGINAEFQREVPCDKANDALYKSLRLAGTCDGILRLWTDKWEQRGVVEIKSINDEGFKEMELAELAQRNHRMQSHIYAYRFNTPIIWVWYYNKNNGKRELKPTLFDEATYLAAVDYFIELDDYARRGELPPGDESWFECKECVYRTKCDPAVLRSRKKSALPVVTLKRPASPKIKKAATR